MEQALTAITVPRIPGQAICGVVVLEQESDASWQGRCSRCGKLFHHEPDPTFEQ